MKYTTAYQHMTLQFNRLSTLFAVLVAVLPLLGYSIFLQIAVSHRLDDNLRMETVVLEALFDAQPDYWALRGEQIQTQLEKVIDSDDTVRVLDKNGTSVFHTGRRDAWYFVHSSRPLLVAGQPIGSIDTGICIATELWIALLVLCSSLAMAALILGPLRKLPLTALADVRRTLAQRVHYQQALLDNFPLMVWLKDKEGRLLATNMSYAQNCGHTSPHLLEGKTDFDLWPADLATKYVADDQAVLISGQVKTTEEQIEANGQRIWVETYKSPVIVDGQIVGTFGFARDITERMLVQSQLAQSELLLKTLTRAIPDLVWLKNPQGVYLTCNQRFEEFFGALEKDIVGKTDHDFVNQELADFFQANDQKAMASPVPLVNEEWVSFASDGHRELLETTKTAIFDSNHGLIGVLGIAHDITAAKEHQRQLERIAHFDALTGLPNRVLLADRIQQGMAQAQRRGTLLAVAYLDLDGFKAVNDQHGHETGDKLLVALANRMRGTLRDGDTLARIGGDEFVAVLADLPDVADCVPMLMRLLAAAAQSVQVGAYELHVSASLGVTFHPQPEVVEGDQLLRQADQAMYQAKLAGKNRYHVFDAEQDRSMRDHHDSLDHIRRALHEDEFVLYYQPKVNMRTGMVIGAEALIRWQHPVRGLLAPAVFLPVVENHPLAVDLGEWVIHAALTQMETWHASGLDLAVSVNVGARQLQQFDFPERLHEILAMHPGINPACLQLELLETSALEDLAHVSQVIEKCRSLGISFALDDFGTGYSSLTYLKRLHVDLLKVDQSFVRDMLDNTHDLSILEGVIGLARAFRREVIAEGVETIAHGEVLLGLGCELAQGYGIARPMPAPSLPDWVLAWRPDPAWALTSMPSSGTPHA